MILKLEITDLMKRLRKYFLQIVMNFLFVLFFLRLIIDTKSVLRYDSRKITPSNITRRTGNNRITKISAKSVFPQARCVTQCLMLTCSH